METCQLRVLTLNKNENLEKTLFRLEKEWHLRFVLGPSLHASSVRIFCNYPKDSETAFNRRTYYELKWKCSNRSSCDNYDVFTEIKIFIAGSFNYYFTVDHSDNVGNADGQGYFLVDPTLLLGAEDRQLTLDCIMCQSVISKCLGPFDEWEGRLYVSKACGYNMVHFSPIQALGTSNSAYSIKDQLQLNPACFGEGHFFGFQDVERLIQKMHKEWNVLSLTDLVLNHTADNSSWLQEHPECGVSLENSPHLKPAYVLDHILMHFSMNVADGKFANRGVPNIINEGVVLQRIKDILLHEVIPSSKLHEFYVVDVDEILKRFKHGIEENREIVNYEKEIRIIQDPEFRRNECRVDMDTAIKLYNIDRIGADSCIDRIKVSSEHLRNDIEKLNNDVLAALQDHIHKAVDNFVGNVAWRFLDPKGPKITTVSRKEPLMHSYFIVPDKYHGTFASEEAFMYGNSAKYIFACTGWVIGDDPLRNFAKPGSNVYLTRELIGWRDSVKLNYGEKPEDCEYLWHRMKEYTEMMAKMFHGMRLDNCHSTPIHVAEYMLDAARKIHPDLYVVAELFTGSEHLDNLFINRLGINSIIREAMSVKCSHDLGALIHQYGGVPVGSFIQPHIQPLVPSIAHALLFDQTHDNESPIHTKSAYDMLPSAALVSMACCATGSNRGYDQMVPHHIHVANETRKYSSWASWDFPEHSFVNKTVGIIRAKTLLNTLHLGMGGGGMLKTPCQHDQRNFTQVYVDDVAEDTVSVTRHNPVTHESVILVARTAFHHPEKPNETGYIKPITIQGVIETVLFEIQMCHSDAYMYKMDPDYINGLPDYYLEIQENIPPSLSKMVEVNFSKDGTKSVVNFICFTPGSVIAFKSVLPTPAQSAILEIRQGLSQFGYLMKSYSGQNILDDSSDTFNFQAIVDSLSLLDLNIVLYKIKDEEEADGNGFSVYHIPGHGDLKYCGIVGVVTVLESIRANNNLGHALCNNLRDGNWLPSYMACRLLFNSNTKHLGTWFKDIFNQLAKIPRYLIPLYFDAIVTGAYLVLRAHAVRLMSDFVKEGSAFIQTLAMGSIAFYGYVANACPPVLSPNLKPPKPPTVLTNLKIKEQMYGTLAAGFPHFAVADMQNWGRDTFISLRGLLLLTGRYQEARYLILAYAGCLRYGLIPNLLNKGHSAYYNCRDAVWWWLQAIQEYCKFVPTGVKILQDKVTRLFPKDDFKPKPPEKHEQCLFDVMQEALQRHANGVIFLDTYSGFENEIGVRWDLGFVFGGNDKNCGTWMDRMGSSVLAGNWGKPATPRDGSAVELVGLLSSVTKWLDGLSTNGLYPHKGVDIVINESRVKMTFKEWHNLICKNFEQKFWVNTEPVPGEECPELMLRRGFYKDTYNATQFWSTTQLRPNFPMAMVVAPELFMPERAWIALQTAQDHLLGPLGMKTLDPSDESYVPYYDSAVDCSDARVSRGFSYHQGPEWVWPIGFFLRAKLHFAKVLEPSRPGILKETMLFIKTTLTRHYEEVVKSSWRSLPELTNDNGAPNRFASPAQAWSMSCILDVLHDLEILEMGTDKKFGKFDNHGGTPVI